MNRVRGWLPLLAVAALGGISGGVYSTPAYAGELEVVDTFNFIDARQPNLVGLHPGTRISFGLDLKPTGTPLPSLPDTTVVATQGTLSVPVPYIFSPALPNQFFNSVDYPTHAEATGAWTFTYTNPDVNSGAPQTVSTQSLATATPPPFATDVQVSGGLTPTIEWARPGSYVPDNQTIAVFDLSQITDAGVAPLIYKNYDLGPSATSCALPVGILEPHTSYAFAVELDEFDGEQITARSRSFVDFTPLPVELKGSVFLPVVGPDTNLSDNLGAPYQFNVGVTEGEPIAIDPLLAVGYEYRIGPGDPLFSSVMLPDIGDDDGYWLCRWVGGSYSACSTLYPNITYEFGGAGVDRFEVLDIDPGLSPLDATAFATTLTFAGDGRFTGTMTPILADVSEPGTVALFGLALCMMLAMFRRGEKQPR